MAVLSRRGFFGGLFVLAAGLMPVRSIAYQGVPIKFDDLVFEPGPYATKGVEYNGFYWVAQNRTLYWWPVIPSAEELQKHA